MDDETHREKICETRALGRALSTDILGDHGLATTEEKEAGVGQRSGGFRG